ncbi:NAD(P)/FAD-dependent oxidoreductase [Sphingomonas yunnanensis]|uniref:NAD(P)/FAD-dependent oxidoreductase n=1 Tax=Sphingomonas yunnanensis TaxID=310400 RepID=UPI001CA78C9C|nr:NAD(P)/FAD-dependent oxidoreductase [Sphingomonas yunnanensis]MBY9064888.1 NAD(P)/FAD-dependent oxidoreductase [Sphingomonas yunnanensis]
MYDVIVIGGSFAGLSAALQLARARQKVLVVDAGLPRNRFADEAHGFLGQDGRPPASILRDARSQLLRYPTVDIRTGEASAAKPIDDGFAVNLSSGAEEHARRLVLATGVTDTLPSIPGLRERWGESVLHCPYCHGYEVRDLPLAVLAAHPMSPHQALLISDWGPTTYFTQGEFEPEPAELQAFAARGVAVERTPVVELLGEAPALDGVRLEDGRVLTVAAIFTAPRTTPTTPLAAILGCDHEDGPTGPYIKVDQWGATSVEGVWAAGDAATPMHNATLASAAGVLAGIGAHQARVGAAAE